MTNLTITRPDDWHVHLRDGDVLKDTVRDISRYNGRALVMPNTIPPTTNTAQAIAYQARINEHNHSDRFQPLMSLYLTDNTTKENIQEAKASGQVVACKLYPAGATTNSDSGVTDAKKIYPVLEEMEKQGILLLIHGEVTTHDVDIFDREKEFLDTVLAPIVNDFPNLKIVLEHITTADAVEFVKNANDTVDDLLISSNIKKEPSALGYWSDWMMDNVDDPLLTQQVSRSFFGLGVFRPHEMTTNDDELSYEEWIKTHGVQLSVGIGEKNEPRVRLDYQWHERHEDVFYVQVEVPF